MKILLLGATGRTGRLVLDEALLRGHIVHAIVRNKSKLSYTSPKLILFEGDVMDRRLIKSAMDGCAAILNILNISRTSDFPWARLRTAENFLSEVMKNIIAAASDASVKRIVICTAWGVNETRKELPGWFRWFIDNSNIKYPYRDHERQERLLMGSSLEWTIVRPVGLTNAPLKEIQVGFDGGPKPKLMISRKSVAKFMVDQLESDSYIKRSPTISDI